ncbi:galactosylceramide sulfotransferase [Siniperca chuatsi]|uniref:galactosylceramide sulfotransferase n=1 Tax=Siniperca chuatsi TaxID=119488 RepID=UPI001CE2307A|nr:galactosylceramide sulfotransferase [Siniperca chuatsi]XP_044030108.1 galactosylceramide sulfotransferase [Siniperca chuatsi]XP_044030109.1 galactosylceramide sulfotransferase [Siniperca chuatsi]XP_044030110.1 galactosylceramide sulfotransferase [Siniperca chuatsi]XP_044030111.1 galactosylceramide sulfotransferase [Siniperca chuatsi]XP_044030112.1 galactosylceramide sulfotransferase [Siniperca chuatsi]XP_044030113.1 galactosylceramide sulfotransferase [Siniperca chuatsi]
MMFGIKGKKCTLVIRRLILWILLTKVMLVLYCLTDPTQVKNRGIQEDTCPLSMAKLLKKNVTTNSESTKSQSEECSPTVNIMFLKTHKTASSTILNILFRFGEKHKLKFAFPDGRNDFFYPSPFLCSQVKDYRPGDCFNIVCNHMRFDHQEVAKLLPSDAVSITILRDPVDLFESSFHYYHRTVPLTWKISGGSKLAEFLNNPQIFYSPKAFNSFYLKNLLFFDFGFDNNLEADDPRVMTDIHNLSKRFDLVLIAEYFEESLILLKDTLCWTTEDILYFKLNARKSSSVSRLTPELRAKALQWNGADWRLYQHFNATFWARVEEFGRERMKQEVKELRRRNAEMKAICIEDGGAVEAQKIQNRRFLPWQPVGESSILGYNMKKNIDPKFRTICEKMLTPEIQYLSNLGVSLWLTRLWGWFKDTVFTV